MKFQENFFSMLKRNPQYSLQDGKRVFVFPIFEVAEGSEIPENKSQLQRLHERDQAVHFHKFICEECHRIPKYTEWMNLEETGGLNGFATTKRKWELAYWEPLYVGTNADPLYDERLTWEGRSDKMSQAFVMCLLDYDFIVLDNAFLTHKAGIKKPVKSEDEPAKLKDLVDGTNKMISEVIRPELETLYGVDWDCHLGK